MASSLLPVLWTGDASQYRRTVTAELLYELWMMSERDSTVRALIDVLTKEHGSVMCGLLFSCRVSAEDGSTKLLKDLIEGEFDITCSERICPQTKDKVIEGRLLPSNFTPDQALAMARFVTLGIRMLYVIGFVPIILKTVDDMVLPFVLQVRSYTSRFSC